MNQFLKTSPEIKDWLDRMEVKNYRLVVNEAYGFVVDVEKDVGLVAKNLEMIPVKFRQVDGYFDCSMNWLKSLRGCPDTVHGNFFCDYNDLINLMDCPQFIKGELDCSHNKLVSLRGCPKSLSGDFLCYYNCLTTLSYGPETVDGIFNGSDNLLTNLDFLPKCVGSGNLFVCENNQALGDLQDIEDFEKIRQIQRIVDKAKKEQFELSKIIEINKDSAGITKNYKI